MSVCDSRLFDEIPVEDLRQSKVLFDRIHAVALLEIEALLPKHLPQVFWGGKHPADQLLWILCPLDWYSRGLDLPRILGSASSCNLASLSLETWGADGAIGDIRGDGSVLEWRGGVAVDGNGVEKVRREFRALDSDVPAQGETVVDVGGEHQRGLTAELHAWNIIIWQQTTLTVYPACIISPLPLITQQFCQNMVDACYFLFLFVGILL